MNRIISAWAALFRVADRLNGLVSRVDIPEGILTDCPSSILAYDMDPNDDTGNNTEESCNSNSKAAYRFYQLCIVPLVFKYIYALEQKEKTCIKFLKYRVVNQMRKHMYRGEEETFLQPYFNTGFVSNVPPATLQKGFEEFNTGSDHPDYDLREVSAYDPLFNFDLDIIKDEKYSREHNFFDHFVSHRYKNLRGT